MGVGAAEPAFERDVVIGHQEERVGRGKITRRDHQGGLVPLAIEARSERGDPRDAIDRSVRHFPGPSRVSRLRSPRTQSPRQVADHLGGNRPRRSRSFENPVLRNAEPEDAR